MTKLAGLVFLALLTSCTFIPKREIPILTSTELKSCSQNTATRVRVWIYEDSEEHENNILMPESDLRGEIERVLINGQQFKFYDFLRETSSWKFKYNPEKKTSLDDQIKELPKFDGGELFIYIRKLKHYNFGIRNMASLLTLGIIPFQERFKTIVGVKLSLPNNKKSFEKIIREDITINSSTVPYPGYAAVGLKDMNIAPIANAVEVAVCDLVKVVNFNE